MNSDTADVGYEGTLGMDSKAGSPGLWVGRKVRQQPTEQNPLLYVNYGKLGCN